MRDGFVRDWLYSITYAKYEQLRTDKQIHRGLQETFW